MRRWREVLRGPLLALGLIAATAASAAEPPLMRLVERSDEQSLVLSARLNRGLVSEGLLAFQDGPRLLVPLGALMAALEVAIAADPEHGTADGFFIDEKRRFHLDLAAGTARFDGRALALPAQAVERQINDIYVESSLFYDWFAIRLRLDLQNLFLEVSSLDILPVQERLDRERRRSNMRKLADDPAYEALGPASRMLGWPVLDTSIEFSTRRDAGRSAQNGRYTTIGTGMVAGLDYDVALNGDVPGEKPSVRAIFGRRDPRGALMGPLDLREAIAGDVSTSAVPLVANSTAGRGATISTFDFNRVSETQRVTLRGELPVGWEVELLRGDELLDYQTSSRDNRYEFHVPTVFGLNAFRLVFYGPQGQRREQEQPVFIGADMMQEGETGFRIAANQQNRDLFDSGLSRNRANDAAERFDQLARNQRIAETHLNDGRTRVIAELEHGVSDTISLFGSLASVPLGGETLEYAQAGARGSWLGALASLQAATSSSGGLAYGFALQSRIDDLSWVLSHDQFQHFVSERSFNVDLGEPLSSISRLQLNGALPNFGIGRLPFATGLTYQETQSGTPVLTLDGRLTTFLDPYTLSSETSLNVVSPQETKSTEAVRVGTRFGEVGLRGELLLDLDPHPGFSAARVTADFRLDPDLNMRLGAVHFGSPPAETVLTAGLARLFDKFAVGADANLSDKGDFSLLFKVSFGFGVEPRSGSTFLRGESIARTGAVSPRVFLDRDNDGKFGPGDELLSNVRFRGNRAPLKGPTDDAGTAMITGLEPYRPVAFAVDLESLDDPFWKPPEKITTLLPRPGSVVEIDVPVRETGEIDGILEADFGGRTRPLPGVRLYLVDARGAVAAQAVSGHDGFFVLQGMPLGRFTLRADEEQLAKLNFEPLPDRAVVISRDNPALSTGEVVLRRRAIPPSDDPAVAVAERP